MDEIIIPMIRALAAEGRTYRGVIYAGLMITSQGPKVLEFNARFGDPETQPVLTLLETDLVDIVDAILGNRLDSIEIKWKKQSSVCVVLASGGYPGPYEKGKVIKGLDLVPADVMVFHAGTAMKNGEVVTTGGRVLGVAAVGADILSAIKSAYGAIEKISFDGMQYRKDIGYRAIERSR
jgi:phosphoribosylamine--glycine ligase